MQKVLSTLSGLHGKPIETLSPAEARLQPTPADAVKKILEDENNLVVSDSNLRITNLLIDGPLGQIPLHIYTPLGDGPFPVLMYYHGGGFVIASSKTYEASIRALAKGAQAIVVAVDYHQAPEFPFPAAVEDAVVAYQWVLDHAQELNGDPENVAVSGESAGGNLAAVVSLIARDKKIKSPVHQLLIYPVLNDDLDSNSYLRNANAKPLNKEMMKWFFSHYAADATSPYALPIKAPTLRDLPSATIITAEVDPLMCDGKFYADRLRFEGVDVSYEEYFGVTHEFFGMADVVPKAKEAQLFAVENLLAAFRKRK
ncbi:MAG: alpha/beta hydrolase [Gammaproteobacteria bacterium]|nr:MAG: alpha/beta hydrolase [Gammaproteobacteria bacterium]